jgi:hypothetical protein
MSFVTGIADMGMETACSADSQDAVTQKLDQHQTMCSLCIAVCRLLEHRRWIWHIILCAYIFKSLICLIVHRRQKIFEVRGPSMARNWWFEFQSIKQSSTACFITGFLRNLYSFLRSMSFGMNEYNNPSFNNVSACFIKHVYHNMFRLKSKPSSGVIVYRILNASYH